MVYHVILWDTPYENIPWYIMVFTMVYNDLPWFTCFKTPRVGVHHGITHYMTLPSKLVDNAFSYIVYGKCMVYHGLPVAKHRKTP